MTKSPKVTLDTNCIINLLDFNAPTPLYVEELSEIIKRALHGEVDVAITTRVEDDIEKDGDEQRKKDMLRKIAMLPIVGTVFRIGVSRIGMQDPLGSQGTKRLADDLQKLLFPGGLDKDANTFSNKINDVDHLIGHFINNRDIFVTTDKGILKKSKELKVSPGINVMSPPQCLKFLEKIEAEEKIHPLESSARRAGYYSPALGGIVSFDYSNNNGTFVIGEGLYLFETQWSKASNTCIHAYGDLLSMDGIALAKGAINIADITDASQFDYTSRVRTVSMGQILLLRNENHLYAAVKILNIKDDSRSDDVDELKFEYVIRSDGESYFA